MNLFEKFNLNSLLVNRLRELGYEKPTPIQEETMPLLLEGRDVVGKAETGSGKTAAYGLPLLNMIDIELQVVQGLIIVPTRELAIQVRQELKLYAAYLNNLKISAFYGGHPFSQERSSLTFPPQILVSTPGRLTDHLNRETINLSKLKYLVFDEADKLLELDFQDEIDQIMDATPDMHQTVLFSATMPHKVKQLIERTLKEPVFVESSVNVVPTQLKFVAITILHDEKQYILVQLLKSFDHAGVVVFVNTRAQAFEIAEFLRAKNFSVKALHGGMEQPVRDKMMTLFKNGSASILVATDLASRGIDISTITTIIHFELPDNEETFMHRSGRAGRAGREGFIYALLNKAEEGKIKSWPNVFIDDWLLPKDFVEKSSADTTVNYATIHIKGGRIDKISPKDIVGALIAETGLKAEEIGKIEVQEKFSYVAIPAAQSRDIAIKLNNGKIKGRKFKVSLVN